MQDNERDEILARITKLEAALARYGPQLDNPTDPELGPDTDVQKLLEVVFSVYVSNPSAVHFQQMVDAMLAYQDAYKAEEIEETDIALQIARINGRRLRKS